MSFARAFLSQGPGPIGVKAIFTICSEELVSVVVGTVVVEVVLLTGVGTVVVVLVVETAGVGSVVVTFSGKESGPEHG